MEVNTINNQIVIKVDREQALNNNIDFYCPEISYYFGSSRSNGNGIYVYTFTINKNDTKKVEGYNTQEKDHFYSIKYPDLHSNYTYWYDVQTYIKHVSPLGTIL